MGESVKSKYKPKSPTKYAGDSNNIICRSSWERKFCQWCDLNENVLQWGSEEFSIPYISPVDGKKHRYFPDFYVEIAGKKYIVEVKPFRQTKEPKTQKKVTKTYINEVFTYAINKAKWTAAEKFCKHTGLKFMLITEKELKV